MIFIRLAILQTLLGMILGCLIAVNSTYGATSLFVQTVDTELLDKQLVLNKSLVFLEETEQRQRVEDVVALVADPVWKRTEEAIPNLGLGVKPHWFALKLINSGSDQREGLLDMSYTMMDYFDVYFVTNGEITEAAKVGDARPFSQRTLAHRNFLIPIVIQPHSETLLVMRAESFGALKLPLSLWSLKGFFQHDQLAIAPQLAFIGIMLALTLYNFFLMLSTRDATYLWYVISMISISLVVMSFHGILAQYVWPEHPQFNNPVLVSSISTSIFAASLFAYTFLSLKRFNWWIRGAFLGLSAAGALVFLLNMFLPYVITIKLAALFSVIGASIGIITGCYLWYRGEVLARFYTVSWFLLLSGSVTITFSHFGWLPSMAIFDYGQQFGAVAEGLLLSFALAYRMNMEKRARYEAQSELLRLQREVNQELEIRVHERTEELAKANDRLLEMSLTDGLTQISNRKCFDQRLLQEWKRAYRDGQMLSLIMIDGDHFKSVNDNYGHLCGDAVLKHFAQIFQSCVNRAGDFVARYGGEEFVVILSNTDLDGAERVAERIRKEVAESAVPWEGELIPLTISVGVAGMVPRTDMEFRYLISAADEALYEAKQAGRNCVVVSRKYNDGEVVARKPVNEASRG